ncbi:MAG: hypothetical protein OEZ20_04995 [candidate division WOR-3 bacterium]|nr:hypothetical protein [candidate division WOR-3 bacterium]MDH5683801.1 hypothetical protein [candidate division WOR-3 bacterium]
MAIPVTISTFHLHTTFGTLFIEPSFAVSPSWLPRSEQSYNVYFYGPNGEKVWEICELKPIEVELLTQNFGLGVGRLYSTNIDDLEI